MDLQFKYFITWSLNSTINIDCNKILCARDISREISFKMVPVCIEYPFTLIQYQYLLAQKIVCFSIVSHLIHDKCDNFMRHFCRILPKTAGIQANSQQLYMWQRALDRYQLIRQPSWNTKIGQGARPLLFRLDDQESPEIQLHQNTCIRQSRIAEICRTVNR